MDRKILIVVDMQKDFVKNTNVLGSDSAMAIMDQVADEIRKASENGDCIIFTRDTHTEEYLHTHEGRYLPVPHCIRGTDGWKVMDELVEAAGNAPVVYVDKGSFGYADWKDVLDREVAKSQSPITGIWLAGVCTDICVVSNALVLRALYPEMDITVMKDCCAGTSQDAHNAALTVMKSCHIDVM